MATGSGNGVSKIVINNMKRVAIALSMALALPSAYATESFHYLSLDQGQRSGGLWLDFNGVDQRDWFNRFTEPSREATRSTLALNQDFANYAIHWGAANSQQQNAQALGLDYNGFSVTGFRGDGDTISTVIHPYNNVGNYQFHGGLNQQYEYSGVQVGYDFTSDSSLNFSHARIKAPGFNDRSAYELSLSGRNLSLSLVQVEEAGNYAGQVVNASVYVGRYIATLQHLKADNDARYASLSLQTTTPKGRELGLMFEQRVNPLFSDGNENRLTLRYGFRFGARSTMRLEDTTAEEDTGNSETVQKKSNTTAILVGVGAVGAALALSGGSGGGGDGRARYATQQTAAFDVLNNINPTSINQNLEYGGYVYRNSDGSYSSTRPQKGQPTSVLLPNPSQVAPGGSRTTASYHTHAAFDPGYDNENFSPQDLRTLNQFQIDGYLGTPMGQFKYASYTVRTIFTIGGPGYLATGF